jgi:hypothetical protein
MRLGSLALSTIWLEKHEFDNPRFGLRWNKPVLTAESSFETTQSYPLHGVG